MKNLSTSFTILCIVLSLFTFTVKAQSVPCNVNAPVSYTLSETSPGEIYIPNASSKPWKGGDTLKIPAKTYSLIEISNFSGDACKKIIIINSGGQVVVNTWRMRNDSRYFRITGTGKTGIDYGFKINGGMMAISLAHHFEVDHVEATGGSLGFYFKSMPDITIPRSIYTPGSSNNYVISDIYIHHNYLHHINGEAMYIGHTGPSGDQEGTNLIPIRLDNVEIAYNTITNVDWDGIQLSNARNNAKIHNNIIWNFGRINKGAQQAGIILGGNTSGDIYNNTISKGTGTGIQVFGYGPIKIYNNTIDSTGNDLTSMGQESVYCNDNITGPETNPKQQIYFYNNIVRNPMPKGAVRVTWYNNNSLAASLTDNQYFIPNAATNWQTFHVVANPPNSIKTNNILIGSSVQNMIPVANAGADKSITLPVSLIALSGSGSDNDGNIVSYSWTKISGPAAIISSPLSALTNVINLLQGEYVFELKVTDNNGATGTDRVTISVNPLVIIPPVTTDSKLINVNISNATIFNNSQWNNWNSANLTSARFAYSDGVVSNVSAVISSQSMLSDNGASYASSSTLVPGTVLRFNSASTSNRVLTIKGLDKLKKYNLMLYGSRATTGNKTIFSAGSIKDTLNTDNNISDVAVLNNLIPDNSGNVIVSISRLGTWNYLAGFTIADAALPVNGTNQLPVASAGIDKSITLPDNSIVISGNGTDNDGTIVSYTWVKISGPAATLSNVNTSSLSISNLSEGVYSFQLTVTDNAGLISADLMQLTVNASTPSPVSGKVVNVNISNSTNYANSEWNNWNVSSSLTSLKFKYSDASASNISAVLNSQSMLVDNGASYASSSQVVPGAVLRFNSASTSTRLLTIKGLIPGKVYDLEIYGSRASTGNKTVISNGSAKDTINTDNNINDVGRLNQIIADNNGNIEVAISRIGTWNYIAGFTIKENSSIAVRSSSQQQIFNAISVDSSVVVSELFTTAFIVSIKDGNSGAYTISLKDKTGKIVLNKSGVKSSADITESFNAKSLLFDDYEAKIITSKGTFIYKVFKKIVPVAY